MIVAELDTNVLASGFIGEAKLDSTPGELVRRWRSKAFALVVSDHILAELAETFTDPCFTRRLSELAIAEVLEVLRVAATIQPLTDTVSGIASHPEDDVVLATALSAGADCVVTGDKALLARVAYRGTFLVSPRQFLKVLDRERAG